MEDEGQYAEMTEGIKQAVLCECGVLVEDDNWVRHQKSKGHKISVMRALHLAQRGGKDGLWACPCGEYITFPQRAAHMEGKRHIKRMDLVSRGADTCFICNLPYSTRLALHLEEF